MSTYDEADVDDLLKPQLERMDDPKAEKVMLFGIPVEELSRRHLVAGLYLAMDNEKRRSVVAEQEQDLFRRLRR